MSQSHAALPVHCLEGSLADHQQTRRCRDRQWVSLFPACWADFVTDLVAEKGILDGIPSLNVVLVTYNPVLEEAVMSMPAGPYS